jgi:hypothetical protein
MKTIVSIFILLIIGVGTSFAKEKKWKKKKRGGPSKSSQSKEVEIPVNIGLGPALFILPGPFEGFQIGFQTELYAAISPELVQANKDKVPKKYRKYAKMIKGETRVSPFPISILPDAFIISPKDDSKGKNDQAYGVIWSSMFGVGILSFGESKDFISYRLGLGLPSIMYIYGGGHRFVDDNQHLVGLGADAYSFIDMRFTPRVHLSFSARSQAYVTNAVHYKDHDGQEVKTHFFPIHRFAISLNYRFGKKTKI